MILIKQVDGATIRGGEGREGAGRSARGNFGFDTGSHILKNGKSFLTITADIDGHVKMGRLIVINHQGN